MEQSINRDDSMRSSSAAAVPATTPLLVLPPRGLEALNAKCRAVYPSQPNPLQVTAVVKFWLGGPDPLDYISMYANDGDATVNVPAHWHYISFGLSDLHGDGRVHDVIPSEQLSESTSGFGFELSFRLVREPGEMAPPTWPATLMQALAKYVFRSGNALCPGDHVSWHCSLDYSESRIQHMLMCSDPQMGSIQTPFGQVEFVQIVGVTKDELEAAQHWSVTGVLDILKKLNGTGGEWLVTDVRRGESMQELDPTVSGIVKRGIEQDGSNLSGVSGRCSWVNADDDTNSNNRLVNAIDVSNRRSFDEGRNDSPQISPQESQQIKSELTKGLKNATSIKSERDQTGERTLNSLNYERYIPESCESGELIKTQYLNSVHLTFNLEAGILLPLCIRGRIKHGRHFTFKSMIDDTAITLVASTVTGSLVNPTNPYAAHGLWLQVFIPDSLATQMARDFDCFRTPADEISLPKTFSWPSHRLYITVVADF